MSATMVIDRPAGVDVEKKPQPNQKTSEVCTCGVAHMSSHNASCRVCSLSVTAKNGQP